MNNIYDPIYSKQATAKMFSSIAEQPSLTGDVAEYLTAYPEQDDFHSPRLVP